MKELDYIKKSYKEIDKLMNSAKKWWMDSYTQVNCYMIQLQ